MNERLTLDDGTVDGLRQTLGERGATLAANLVTFARLLRIGGFDVTSGRLIDAGRCLLAIDIDQREDVRSALRACLVSNVEEIPLFDLLFDSYWSREPGLPALLSRLSPQQSERLVLAQARQSRRTPVTPLPAAESITENPTQTYSSLDLLTTKDFASYSSDDLRQGRRILRQLAPRLATALGRRRRSARSGGSIDLRRSLRHAVSNGGEVVELFKTRRRIRKLRLVVLCDVSGSMDIYSRFLVQFLYAIQNELRGVSTFVFSTRLNEVTHLLRTRSFDEALLRLADQVDSWSGGTSIGASLFAFDRLYARRRVSSRTVILIISDGWDRGDTGLLTKAMQSFRRRAFKVIWLNPLLGHADYRPLAKGMAAALPYTDFFLPAHNFESLARLGRTLVSLAGQ